MNISPVQLVHLTFHRVSIETDTENLAGVTAEGGDAHGMFDGVIVRTGATKNRIDKEDHRGTPYFLTLRLLINNEADPSNSDQKFSPYKLDVEAGGVVIVANGADALGDSEDLVTVNGLALIWGAIREQVATITSRMPAGTALLPSVNFLDMRKGLETGDAPTSGKESSSEKPAKTTPKRTRARKS